MAIKTIITRGYGNGTFSGSIKDVVTKGYSIATITVSNPEDYLFFSRAPIIPKNDRLNANLKR